MERAVLKHLKKGKIEAILGQERKYMAGFWATQDEVKKVLKEVNEIDEQAVTNYLAEGNAQTKSQSCNMCRNWNLDRGEIRKILAHLAEDRTLQTTFGNLLGATIFKAGKQGKLWHTVCPKCKERIDSWSHCAECYQLEIKEAKNEKQWLANIKEIIKEIKTATPAKYITSEVRHTQYREEVTNTESEEHENDITSLATQGNAEENNQ